MTVKCIRGCKAVVAGAAGPASAGPLFWPTMVSAEPLFSIAAAVLSNESRLIGEIISNTRRCENKHHKKHEACQNIAVIKMTPI